MLYLVRRNRVRTEPGVRDNIGALSDCRLPLCLSSSSVNRMNVLVASQKRSSSHNVMT